MGKWMLLGEGDCHRTSSRPQSTIDYSGDSSARDAVPRLHHKIKKDVEKGIRLSEKKGEGGIVVPGAEKLQGTSQSTYAVKSLHL